MSGVSLQDGEAIARASIHAGGDGGAAAYRKCDSTSRSECLLDDDSLNQKFSSENAVAGSCAGFLRRIGGTPSQACCTPDDSAAFAGANR
jgi:hypothetical protein